MASPDVIIWSEDAQRDTDDIWDYLKDQASVRVADETIGRIVSACDILERHPYAGRPRDELIPGMRSLLSNPYTIFYRLTASKVEVVRVLHQKRDLEAIFNKR